MFGWPVSGTGAPDGAGRGAAGRGGTEVWPRARRAKETVLVGVPVSVLLLALLLAGIV